MSIEEILDSLANVARRNNSIVSDAAFEKTVAGADEDAVIEAMVKSHKWERLDNIGFIYFGV